MNPMRIKVDYPHLVEEKNRHGRPKLKVRYRGKRKGLDLMPGMAGFSEEYARALHELRTAAQSESLKPLPTPAVQPASFAPRSLGWLIERYFRESSAFATMKLAGQRRRRATLGALKTSHGHKGMMIPRAIIEAGVASRAAQRAKANEWLKAVKALYSWALAADIVPSNPATGVRKLRIVTDGYHTWTVEEFRAFVIRHPRGTMAYLALMIMLFAGLRRSDAIIFGRQHISGGMIKFRTGKTGGELATALPAPLADAIAAMGQINRMVFLVTSYGEPFRTGASFYLWFKKRAIEAGIPHCTPHGIRKGSTTIADEEGASEDQLNAMFTWVNPNMSATYTKKASRIKLATEGFRKVEERLIREGVIGQIGNGHVAPRAGLSEGATKTGS
jgi:integrase